MCKKESKCTWNGLNNRRRNLFSFQGKTLHSKAGHFKATMSLKHLPYFLQPFSLDHLQDLFMAHGCVGVFLQNLKEQ